MIEKWHQLQQRERHLLIAMAAAIGILLFYLVVWQPMHDAVTRGEQRLSSQQNTLEWMRKSVSRVLLSRSATPRSTAKVSGSLSQRVNRSARDHKITLSRLQPQKDELSVRIDQAEFNSLLAWLQTLQRQRVEVVAVDLARDDQVGMVKVRKLQLRIIE
ncbi:type II secretion system protein M [Neiella marina]|uniref:Type II secretion system protein M n=1 Tax=Neiella holothuriorum TaxID=2870530 RepID=A0ABS7EG74_9GAMM|nr:type II secretion system protein M [Neiella holothuriorum]MBW8191265.1 type II secretion system protein M [Neiella holothuriorum]